MKAAIIFPGQGVQQVGMGADIIQNHPVAQAVFQEANELLKMDLLKMVLEGPAEDLNITSNTQPAIITTTIAILAVLKESFTGYEGTAGLSLGEYASLIASNSLTLAEALPLVRCRGELMLEAVPQGTGAMAAVLGFDKDRLVEICREISNQGHFVAQANYNSLQQIVISGETEGVQLGMEAIKADGGKVIPLNVAAPFHTPLLEKASKELAMVLDKIEIKEPKLEMFFNVTGQEEKNPEKIKGLLTQQVMSPVLWLNTMENMLKKGYDTFIEVGPGKTLTGFFKKLPYDFKVYNVNSLGTLEKTLENIGG